MTLNTEIPVSAPLQVVLEHGTHGIVAGDTGDGLAVSGIPELLSNGMGELTLGLMAPGA